LIVAERSSRQETIARSIIVKAVVAVLVVIVFREACSTGKEERCFAPHIGKRTSHVGVTTAMVLQSGSAVGRKHRQPSGTRSGSVMASSRRESELTANVRVVEWAFVDTSSTAIEGAHPSGLEKHLFAAIILSASPVFAAVTCNGILAFYGGTYGIAL
jgi:hypothetical protein